MVQPLRIDLHRKQHRNLRALFAGLQPHHLEIEDGVPGRLLQRRRTVRRSDRQIRLVIAKNIALIITNTFLLLVILCIRILLSA